MRIHICGPSGSGTTTLGKILHERLGYTHLDSDDYFWMPTTPAYTEKRPIEQRQQLLGADLRKSGDLVVTGTLIGWGDMFIPLLDLVVYLWVPTNERIRRLKERETREFGIQALAPGGDMHDNHKAFLQWASEYDTGGLDIRSKALHDLWLSQLPCPVLRIEGEVSAEYSLKLILDNVRSLARKNPE